MSAEDPTATDVTSTDTTAATDATATTPIDVTTVTAEAPVAEVDPNTLTAAELPPHTSVMPGVTIQATAEVIAPPEPVDEVERCAPVDVREEPRDAIRDEFRDAIAEVEKFFTVEVPKAWENLKALIEKHRPT